LSRELASRERGAGSGGVGSADIARPARRPRLDRTGLIPLVQFEYHKTRIGVFVDLNEPAAISPS